VSGSATDPRTAVPFCAVFSSLNNFLSTAPHKVADAAALAKAAGEKLISQVTTMRVVCTRENEAR
jgi:hypothetical protein